MSNYRFNKSPMMQLLELQACSDNAQIELLADWAFDEFHNGNRIKASKLFKIAQKMEELYKRSKR